MDWNQDQGNNGGAPQQGSGYPGQNGTSYDKPNYSSAPPPQQQQHQQPAPQQNNYQSNNNGGQRPAYNGGNRGGNGGGFQRGGGGGGNGGFKPREVDPNPQLYLPYAVGGNKNPPQQIVEAIHRVAKQLESMGYTMRSGGMQGVEDIFEKATSKNEIHLPWRDFDKKFSKLTFTPPEAKTLASRYQPGYDGLPNPVQTFLAKNVRVLFGNNLKSPALFVVAWSEDGCESARDRTPKTGDVGHMVAIASAMRIPVFNLSRADGEQRLMEYLNKGQEPINQGAPQQNQGQQHQGQPQQQQNNGQNFQSDWG